MQMAGGYCIPRYLHVVADLGVADALDETPQTASDLAAAIGADPGALGRVMRLLAAHGVFVVEGNKFRHSPVSELLKSNHPHSMRPLVRMFGLQMNWTTYGAIEHSVRTGGPAADKILPNGYFRYFAEHPEESQIFNSAMMAKAQVQGPSIVAAYDFSSFSMIADIGGGRGHLLRAILDSAPNVRGVLFDLPHVIKEAATSPSDRLTLQAGDFFADPLPVSDAYLLMEVIHDWGDAESVAILKAIRRVAPTHARLLVIEQIVPDDPGPHWSKILDIHMLVLLGGKQRTRQEYETLFIEAGFVLYREIDTGTGISILEGKPQ
jgi:hypothetical protein